MNREKIYQMLKEHAAMFCDEQCPMESETRCCDKVFCNAMLEEHPETRPLYDAERAVPFMRENGCVVDPHLRETCSLFVCGHFLRSKYLKGFNRIIKMLPLRERSHALMCQQHSIQVLESGILGLIADGKLVKASQI